MGKKQHLKGRKRYEGNHKGKTNLHRRGGKRKKETQCLLAGTLSNPKKVREAL